MRLTRQPVSGICQECGKSFVGRRGRLFCSTKCRNQRRLLAFREANPKPEIEVSNGTSGAIGELVVAADLLKKGWEVFRAISPSCSCDLAILKDGKLIRVEVRTGYRMKNGSLFWNKTDKADVMAIYEKNGTITYIPPEQI